MFVTVEVKFIIVCSFIFLFFVLKINFKVKTRFGNSIYKKKKREVLKSLKGWLCGTVGVVKTVVASHTLPPQPERPSATAAPLPVPKRPPLAAPVATLPHPPPVLATTIEPGIVSYIYFIHHFINYY